MGQDTETFYISELQKYKIIKNIELVNDIRTLFQIKMYS